MFAWFRMILLVPLFLAIVTMLPLFTQYGLSGEWGKIIESIPRGDQFNSYYLGKMHRSILDDITPFIQNTFTLVFWSVAVALAAAILFGLFLQRFTPVRCFQIFLQWISTVPDFVIILFSIIVAVSFYQLTHIRVLTLTPSENQSLWFHIMILSLSPSIHLIKGVSTRYYQIGAEDYIRTAMAKGLGIWYILLQHVFRNIKPYLLADLKKVISITITNLFVVEYCLNVLGVSRFLFNENYQVAPVFVGLLTLIILALIIYVLIWGILYLLERIFVYE